MSDYQLLPAPVSEFLDEAEKFLCLIVLIVLVLCTVQLVANQSIDIASTVYQTACEKIAYLKSLNLSYDNIFPMIKDKLVSWYYGDGKADEEDKDNPERCPCPAKYEEDDWD